MKDLKNKAGFKSREDNSLVIIQLKCILLTYPSQQMIRARVMRERGKVGKIEKLPTLMKKKNKTISRFNGALIQIATILKSFNF